MKILYCDDDHRMLELVGEFFRIAGHEIMVTDTAFGLTKQVASMRPDVLLLDYRMPALSGDNYMRVFQSTPAARHTRVIYYSAEDTVRLGELVASTGAVAFIPKSTMGRGLVAEVERILAQGEPAAV